MKAMVVRQGMDRRNCDTSLIDRIRNLIGSGLSMGMAYYSVYLHRNNTAAAARDHENNTYIRIFITSLCDIPHVEKIRRL